MRNKKLMKSGSNHKFPKEETDWINHAMSMQQNNRRPKRHAWQDLHALLRMVSRDKVSEKGRRRQEVQSKLPNSKKVSETPVYLCLLVFARRNNGRQHWEKKREEGQGWTQLI